MRHCTDYVAAFIDSGVIPVDRCCNIISPCGSGKSAIANHIAGLFPGERVGVVTWQTSVLRNLIKNARFHEEPRKQQPRIFPMTCGKLCSLHRQNKLPIFDVIIIDESHHVGIGTVMSEIVLSYMDKGTLIYGLSASTRSDGMEFYKSTGFQIFNTENWKINKSVQKKNVMLTRTVPHTISKHMPYFRTDKERLLYFVSLRRRKSRENQDAFIDDLALNKFKDLVNVDFSDFGMIVYSEFPKDTELKRSVEEYLRKHGVNNPVVELFLQGSKSSLIEDYNKGEVNVLICTNRLDEGVSIKRQTCFISCYNKSSKISKEQRMGRMNHGEGHVYLTYK